MCSGSVSAGGLFPSEYLSLMFKPKETDRVLSVSFVGLGGTAWSSLGISVGLGFLLFVRSCLQKPQSPITWVRSELQSETSLPSSLEKGEVETLNPHDLLQKSYGPSMQ